MYMEVVPRRVNDEHICGEKKKNNEEYPENVGFQ